MCPFGEAVSAAQTPSAGSERHVQLFWSNGKLGSDGRRESQVSVLSEDPKQSPYA